jgi:predicted transposase YdaD
MQVTTSWERKGKIEARQAIALNMLKDNFSLEQISRLTGMTIPEIQRLQAQG